MSKEASGSVVSRRERLSVPVGAAAASPTELALDSTPIDVTHVLDPSDRITDTNTHHAKAIASFKALSLSNQPVTKSNIEYETSSLVNEPRRSTRVKADAIKKQLLDAIQLQAKINFSLNEEIKQDIPFTRYSTIKKDLDLSKQHVHQLYNEYRVLSEKPNKAVTQQVDKLTHDNEVLCNQIDDKISVRAVRSKYTEKTPSLKSNKSTKHSRTSSRTARSTNTSYLRQRQSEANAKLVELQIQLQTNSKTQAIQEQLAKLENAKRTIELESQIETEKQKAAIFSQALAEEEREGSDLMLPANGDISVLKNSVPAGNMSLTSSFAPIELTVQAKQNDARKANQVTNKVSYVSESEAGDTDSVSDIPALQLGNRKQLNQTTKAKHSNTNRPITTSIQHDTYQQDKSVELVKAITMAYRLPQSEPKVFDGNPLQYPRWALSFDNLIGNRQLSDSEKLDYMGKYLEGKALEAVNGYFLLKSDTAYDQARAVLDARYGDPFTVAQGFKTKLEQWPAIKPKDHDGLRMFVDFLLLCKAAKGSLEKLSFLDNHEVHKQILAKLPEFMTRKWVRKATKYQKKYFDCPSFEELCKFMNTEFEMSYNPMYTDIYANKSNESSKQSRPSNSKKVYATLQEKQDHDSFNKTFTTECVYCNMKNHWTAVCGRLGRLPFEEQRKFMKSKNLCFACLNGAHSYKQCENPAICKTCNDKHPTALHNMRTSAQLTN